MDKDILAILACPKCKGRVSLAPNEKGLICPSCEVMFPVRDGVPVLLFEEAQSMAKSDKNAPSPSVEATTAGSRCTFLVVEGQDKGRKIEVGQGTCRALGRSLDDVERTKIFSVDTTLSLDENSKKLVVQYLSRQFQGDASKAPGKPGVEMLGGFLRDHDVALQDISISRLHAMLFYDASGRVGVLDLVSKNGTFVNGAEVESKILKKGDLVAIGGTKIRFEA